MGGRRRSGARGGPPPAEDARVGQRMPLLPGAYVARIRQSLASHTGDGSRASPASASALLRTRLMATKSLSRPWHLSTVSTSTSPSPAPRASRSSSATCGAGGRHRGQEGLAGRVQACFQSSDSLCWPASVLPAAAGMLELRRGPGPGTAGRSPHLGAVGRDDAHGLLGHPRRHRRLQQLQHQPRLAAVGHRIPRHCTAARAPGSA